MDTQTSTPTRRFAQWHTNGAGGYSSLGDGTRWTIRRNGRTWIAEHHRTQEVGRVVLSDEIIPGIIVADGPATRVEQVDTYTQGRDMVELIEALGRNDWDAASYWGDVIGGMVPRP